MIAVTGMRKIEALLRLMETRPLAATPLDWFCCLGITDDTSAEDLEKIEKWLDELSEDEYYRLVDSLTTKLIVSNIDDLEKAVSNAKKQKE